jgi:hypothetical protein
MELFGLKLPKECAFWVKNRKNGFNYETALGWILKFRVSHIKLRNCCTGQCYAKDFESRGNVKSDPRRQLLHLFQKGSGVVLILWAWTSRIELCAAHLIQSLTISSLLLISCVAPKSLTENNKKRKSKLFNSMSWTLRCTFDSKSDDQFLAFDFVCRA